MEKYNVRHSVAMIIYNRPDKVKCLCEQLLLVNPRKVYVIADGPKNEEDRKKCMASRKVVENVKWPGECILIYADYNLGCAQRLPSGLDAVFQVEESCIILEDDCIPCTDFFVFCDELLERYKDDSRIGQICGCNPLGNSCFGQYSYTFSRWGSIWGWATWARAWKEYDINIEKWRNTRIKELMSFEMPRCIFKIRKRIYDKHCCNTEGISTWDYQWTFTRNINSQLSIVPCSNLVINIGEGDDSTHTKTVNRFVKKRYELKYPLVHPDYIMVDRGYDKQIEKGMKEAFGWRKKIKRIKRFLKGEE